MLLLHRFACGYACKSSPITRVIHIGIQRPLLFIYGYYLLAICTNLWMTLSL